MLVFARKTEGEDFEGHIDLLPEEKRLSESEDSLFMVDIIVEPADEDAIAASNLLRIPKNDPFPYIVG